MAGAESRPSQGPADPTGLVRAARAGDERAWSELLAEYGPRVFALARSRLRSPDAAEEVTQSVFATIAIKLRDGQYDEQGKFEPWLFRIAMNRVRDVVRRARREHPGALVPTEPREGAREADPALDSLREAVSRLSRADREIVELRYHAGLSFRQMSELLGEPIGTLLARHHRALRKLQKIMGVGDREPGARQLPAPAAEARS